MGELEPKFEKAYREYQSQVELRGFRKGKAPLGMVKKVFGEAIEYQSIENIAQDVFRTTLEERAVRPIGQPLLRDIDYKRGEALTFKVAYEIMPEIPLRDYKGIAADRLVHTVTDEEVDTRIERLLRRHSTLAEAESVADKHHVIHADFQQLDEAGSPIIGEKLADVTIDLTSTEYPPEMRDPFVGAKLGETKRITTHVHDNDGKPIERRFDATVVKIERIVPPEMTPELIKSLSDKKASTEAELRSYIRGQLESSWKQYAEDHTINQIMDEIVRRNEFEVPESFIHMIQDEDLEALRAKQPNKRFPASFNEEEYRKETRARTIWQAKWSLLRERILETDKIVASDDDLAKRAEESAVAVGMTKEKLLEFYKTSDVVKNDIVHRKLIDFLFSNSTITDKKEEDEHESKLVKPKEPELLVKG